MAWTTPATFVSGAILTAAQLNTNVRDNTNFLYGAPKCKVNNDFDTIATSTLTAYSFSSEEYDNDGMHSTSTNPERVTIITAGVYFFLGLNEWADNTTGRREGTLRLNGTTNIANTKVGMTATAGGSQFQTSVMRFFNAGDYVEQLGWQNSGGNLSVLGLLCAHWLSN